MNVNLPLAAAETIPVINVSEPVHEVVTVIAAVCRLEVLEDRVVCVNAVLLSRIILEGGLLSSCISL